MAETQQFILLPKEGIRALDAETRSVLLNLPSASSTQFPTESVLEAAGGESVSVIDSINEDGAKLVDMTPEAAERTNSSSAPVRAVPVVYYDRPDLRLMPMGTASVAMSSTFIDVQIECLDAVSGGPVQSAQVVAFTDFDARIGDSGLTNSDGKVELRLANAEIERLYVYPPTGFWGTYRETLPNATVHSIRMAPIDLNNVDVVRHYYGNTRFNPAAGVKVGVIDSGVGPHSHLNTLGGVNTVTGEPDADWHDGDAHGTHVAGLIGAMGIPPTGLQGVAPNIGIFAYRVFGQNASGASNYAILKAMIRAGMHGCDIINLSLGGGPADSIVNEAIQDAREQGMLVVVAAGNDGRRRVSYPAAYGGATAISAMGREGTFPRGSLEEADIIRPPASPSEPQEFIAGFSNVGTEIAVTGPGVGTLSTLPNDKYGPMSGTSMAAPVVAGAAASLLSQNQSIFDMPRDRARSEAIERMLQSNCIRRGFGQSFEGYGLPDPSAV
ncbi:S8 family serine peptidase [Rhodobacteraceae bacterium]|nr:S8 family serine peptidase [Paracoccaceae bacterium]